MPSVGTGAVPITPVDQRVSTPGFDVSPNPLRAEPIQSDAGAALREGGQQLFGIFAAQKAHADAIDVATRMGQFQQDFGTAKQAALNSGQQAPDMVTNLQKAGADLTQQYTQGTTDPNNPNPPNRAVARELQLAMARHVAEQMGSFPSEAAVRVARDLDYKFNQQTSTAAAQIGQQYQVGGTADKPTFDFTADGMQAAQQQQQTIDKAYPPQARPTENAFYSQQLREKIAMQTGMMVAQDHPTLIKAYVAQHAAFITPEQQNMLTNRANESMLGPMHQIEADGKAQEAQLYNQFLTAKSQGTLSDSVVTNAVDTFKLPRELGEQLIGRQIEPQTNPATFNAVRSALDQAGTPEEIEMNLAGVGTPGSGINSTDAAKLRAYGAGLKPVLNDPVKAADRRYGGSTGWIADQYKPKDYPSAIMGSMDPTIKNNAASAQNYYETYKDMVAQGLPPDKAVEAKRKLAEDAVKLYPMPAPLMTKPGTVAKVLAVPPPIVMKFDPARGTPPTPIFRGAKLPHIVPETKVTED